MGSFEAEYKKMNIEDIEGYDLKTWGEFSPCPSNQLLRDMGCTDLVVQLDLVVSPPITPKVTIRPPVFPYIVFGGGPSHYEYISGRYGKLSPNQTVESNCTAAVELSGVLHKGQQIGIRVYEVGTNTCSFDLGLIPPQPINRLSILR